MTATPTPPIQTIRRGQSGNLRAHGTMLMGEAPERVILVETLADAETVQVADPHHVAYATQTTLSLDEVAAIVATLRKRFPDIQGPEAGDVCYATQNRQEAVRALVELHGADTVLVLGSAHSSNARRLREVALQVGARAAHLFNSDAELDPDWLAGVEASGHRRHGRSGDPSRGGGL